MANVLVQDSSLIAVGNAIRAKNGSTTLYKPAEMAAAIQALGGGGGELKYISFTANTSTNGYKPTFQNDNFPDSETSFFIEIKISNSNLAYSGFCSGMYDASRNIWTEGKDGGFSQYKPNLSDIAYDATTKTFTINLSGKEGLLYIFGCVVFCG